MGNDILPMTPTGNDGLGDADRMLDAIDNLQTSRPDRGSLRRMSGTIDGEAKAVRQVEAQLQADPRLKPRRQLATPLL